MLYLFYIQCCVAAFFNFFYLFDVHAYIKEITEV